MELEAVKHLDQKLLEWVGRYLISLLAKVSAANNDLHESDKCTSFVVVPSAYIHDSNEVQQRSTV